MAERIVSPGVFTQERDQSFLATGVAQIGAAFVGPFPKGPAFVPTLVEGIEGLVTTFGEPDGTSYPAYAAKNYLQEAGSATIVRVLGWTDGAAVTKGYSATVANIYASGSNGLRLFATLHPNVSIGDIASVSVVGATSSSFSINISGSTVNFIGSASTAESDAKFITNTFGTSPVTSTVSPAYVYAVYPGVLDVFGTGSVTFSASLHTLALREDYDNAYTPWVQSQTIGAEKYDLFKLHTLSDGSNANKSIKLSITGISPSVNPDTEYGTFSIIVRDFNDTDTSLNVLEEFSNLTLDPASSNYIARRIGNSAPLYNSDTKETFYEGDFRNASRYIRVEMNDDLIPANALPYGFAALNGVVPVGSATAYAPSYITTRISSSRDLRYFYGYDFTDLGNLSYLAPISGSGTVGTAFNVEDIVTLEVNQTTAISFTDRAHVGYRKFSLPLQGGFDGLNPARVINLGADIVSDNTQGFDLTSATASGSVAFKRALNAIANADNVDMNLLVIPGVTYDDHGYIAQEAIDLCESRQDAFYIMDLAGLNETISDITTLAEGIDTNYAAAYYPWVRVLDENTNKLMWAPPSVVLPEVYAYSDAQSGEWYAPAGLNRGGVPGAVGVKIRLSQTQRDTLYESKVNPIAQFPGQGISVWGQKTLQRRASALDRVNVRRLLIAVKKYIASASRYLVFEQNTEATRNRFLNVVNPYLAGIQQRSGLSAFRVVMDDTNNTPDVIDRNILVGSIYLQPTRSAEFIKLDFNILPTGGASFDTL